VVTEKLFDFTQRVILGVREMMASILRTVGGRCVDLVVELYGGRGGPHGHSSSARVAAFNRADLEYLRRFAFPLRVRRSRRFWGRVSVAVRADLPEVDRHRPPAVRAAAAQAVERFGRRELLALSAPALELHPLSVRKVALIAGHGAK
jgi:hypothetical protein